MLNDTPHPITENLQQPLLTLMSQGKTDLWVDALCIDQNDLDEKAAQVQRMATIFQEAETVLIWLGSATPTSDKMLRFLKDGELAKLGQDFWGRPLLVPCDTGSTGRPSIAVFNDAFQEFLDCGYWYRTWVVQEIAVAEKVRLF